jgi:spermidine/putrescine transport system ATP-binding protein
MDNKIVVLKNVNKEYAGIQVVDNINLYVKKGEFVTILGPSGCGKTTTLRMIAGFETVTSGEILLNGVDIKDIPPHKRPINTVFQRYALFPHLDVYDNVAFGLKLKKVPDGDKKDKKGNQKYRKLTKEEIDAKVTRALKIVDLEEFEWRDIQTLSGGQQQRVSIARALAGNPSVILADEPTGALDSRTGKDVMEFLKQLHREGNTIILITHDNSIAAQTERIMRITDGKIVYDGPVEGDRMVATQDKAGGGE